MTAAQQAAILQAMMQPGWYPHPVRSIERRETHISTVFLTGPFAYKIKKPVDLGFLDFSSLDKRRRYCRREVALNRRLSQGVYVDVVPITRHDGRYRLDGPGAAVEVAVKMHQLDESDSMGRLLQKGALTHGHLEALVHRLIDFYTRAATDCTAEADAPPAWDDNLQRVDAFAGRWIDRRQVAFVRTAARAFARTRRALFERRRKDLKIKDGHGDLRADHIYFTARGIQIIDCIEFSAQLRCLDVVSDLAFLVMDLEYRGFGPAAESLIRLYIEGTDDLGALPLLDFYRCYRAMVRCKVSCCRIEELDPADPERDAVRQSAVQYLAMAHDCAAAFNRPVLWLVGGLPASGKSTIAGGLAAVHDVPVIRSDVVRKELFGGTAGAAAATAFDRGIYSAGATEATYGRMFALADEALKKGAGVVIDATFSRRAHRIQALRMGRRRQALPVFVECGAAEPVLAARLKQRETMPSLSDARLVHLGAFKQRYEPVAPIGDAVLVRIDTEAPLPVCLRRVLLAALPRTGGRAPDVAGRQTADRQGTG